MIADPEHSLKLEFNEIVGHGLKLISLGYAACALFRHTSKSQVAKFFDLVNIALFNVKSKDLAVIL